MSTGAVVCLSLAIYLGLNFVCATVLHRHAVRQAHLPVRALDVAVHFVLLTAFAMPALLVVTLSAIFGGREDQEPINEARVISARAA